MQTCALAPAILGATDKSGANAPVLGSGEHTYEAIHDWGELPAEIKYGNTHGVVEDSQGHIYVHHTVNAASESPDSMVVFDAKGQVRQILGQGIQRRRARPAHPQGGQHRIPLPLRHQARHRGEDHARRRRGVDARLSRAIRRLQARPRRQEAEVQPHQPRDRAQRRYLRRRRLRLQLHQPVQQQGRVHPHLRRQGQRGRQAGLPARHHRGLARRLARS